MTVIGYMELHPNYNDSILSSYNICLKDMHMPMDKLKIKTNEAGHEKGATSQHSSNTLFLF